MGYDEGWAAVNIEMPPVVPRTEYSVESHWPVVSAVIGKDVTCESSGEDRKQAVDAVRKAWNFSFMWCTNIGTQYMNGRTTNMGHAIYAEGGVDYDDNISCPFTDPEDVLNFDPEQEYGPLDKAELITVFEEVYKNNVAGYSDAVNMSGVYTTMVSGFIAIFGWEALLEACGTDSVRFGELAIRYENWVRPHFEALAESNVPVVMCHDDMVWTSGAIFDPAWYREFIFPAYKRLWTPIIDAGKRLCFTSDGDYTEFFDDLVDCGAHVFIMEPMCDMKLFAEKYGKTHGFVGNADTRILLSGSREMIRAEVERCMSIGKPCPGFIMAVGNHIPINTPVDSCLWYDEFYKELARR